MGAICWPLVSNVIRRNSNSHTFGWVRKYADGTPKPHQGWDFYAVPSTPCYAISDGKVVYASDNGALGLMLMVQFDHGGQSLYAGYAHLQQILVKMGDTVTMKQKVALTGNSGNASSMTGLDQHLHFEIRTMPFPGKGLAGRISPLQIFGKCPLLDPIMETMQ
ncbi:M23 family metallopeptidase [Sphaerotilus uruguayifluvii]|jgi:murein DD-endopeptidase MepM/ murein hydrolase activator NlpD|uniref:Murein DD-endopeptidase MepM/ murein hydrolase activator NlpD n=1 Tax=Sphaerotilus uruguayifluvii TaxID=2735897 RepID=A0ABX2G2V9_9BURK|nr:M23 family metallopeptidase [Leptothrix sp. C29]NRT56636.1 murein DD-endopeptidase MepM/ murein hydrolase activator NlpD [Leptothrix sp. C29]